MGARLTIWRVRAPTFAELSGIAGTRTPVQVGLKGWQSYTEDARRELEQQGAGGDDAHYLGYSAQGHPAGDTEGEFEGEFVA
jgi:hypothetical protein